MSNAKSFKLSQLFLNLTTFSFLGLHKVLLTLISFCLFSSSSVSFDKLFSIITFNVEFPLYSIFWVFSKLFAYIILSIAISKIILGLSDFLISSSILFKFLIIEHLFNTSFLFSIKSFLKYSIISFNNLIKSVPLL